MTEPLSQSSDSFSGLTVPQGDGRPGECPSLDALPGGAENLPARQLAAVVRADQRARWHAGERVTAETYLARYPALATDLEAAVEVVYGEFVLRTDLGDRPTAEEYVARFPQYEARLRLQLEFDRALDASSPLVEGGPTPSAGAGSRDASTSLPAPRTGGSPWPVVAHYEILEVIGRGGMAVVYKARQAGLNRLVALKMIRAGDEAGTEERARFRAEAEAIARCRHPHLVQVYEVGEHGGRPFLSLEFLEGGSLARRLAGAPQPALAAAHLVETLARAIHAAHEQGVVHRDLKPSNVLLTADGTPKVADFGLAKLVSGAGGQTRTGALVGTPSYMAPEQARGKNKEVGPAADVYSLGAILYELLTGRPPFRGESVLETVNQVVHTEAVPPSRLQPKVPRDLETVCLKCLRKEARGRYASARALADDLERFQAGKPVRARPVGPLPRLGRWARRKPALAGLLTAVAALLVTVAAVSALAAARTSAALDRARRAERTARLREAEALAGQAQGLRSSRRPGQRLETLAAVRKAVALGHDLGQPPAWFDRLRTEAIAALALPDIHITESWDGFPPGTCRADVSADFDWYVRTNREGACTVCRGADGVEIARLPELGEEAAVRFGPGRLLAVTGESSGRCQLWNLAGPEPVLRLDERKPVEKPRFRPDGGLLALNYRDGSLAVYDTDTLTCRYRLGPSAAGPLSAFLHPTEPVAACCSYFSNALQVRDLRTGAVLVSLTLPWRGSGECAWSPDGRTLAVPDGDSGLIHLYAFDRIAPGLRLVRTLNGVCNGGTAVLFNPAGDRLVSRGWNNVVHLFDVQTGRLLFDTPQLPTAAFSELRFDPSGKRLAAARVGELEERIGLWSVADGGEYRALVHDGPGRRYLEGRLPAIHPGGRLAALGLTDGLALFDLETSREVAFVAIPGGGGNACFDGCGNLLTNGRAGLFRWPVRTDAPPAGRVTVGPPRRLPFHPGDRTVDTSDDGQVIGQAMYAGYGMERFAGGWILRPGAPQPIRVDPGTGMNNCDVSPDGRWVAFGVHGSRFAVNVYETATGRRVWQAPDYLHNYCRFSPDGRWLLTDGDGGRAYAAGTWEPGARLGRGIPWDESPGGLAVLGLPEGAYRLVEVTTGREVARLEDPDQVFAQAAFTPDGTRLVVVASDGLRVWDLRLIRAELAEMGLDWAAPPYPPAAGDAARPFEVRVVGAELVDSH